MNDEDPEQGWEAISNVGQGEGKDEGKGKRRRKSNGKGVEEVTPGSLGLKDCSMLAFRFVDEQSAEDGAGDELAATNQWDVVLPGFEDEDENQGEDIEVPDTDLPVI